MRVLHSIVVAAVSLMASLPAAAQTPPGQCILAGRLGDAGWAPRLPGVQLLDASGQPVLSAEKSTLGTVRQAKLEAPALLSRCDGDAPLAAGPAEPGARADVPALSPGVVAVESVHYPRLGRAGELVELRVTVPAERVVMLTR